GRKFESSQAHQPSLLCSFGSAGLLGRGCRAVAPAKASARGARQEAFVFWYGAIAQLGERVLCKHEVVGSIPSGSTTLRPLGFAWRRHAGEKAKGARRTPRPERGWPTVAQP